MQEKLFSESIEFITLKLDGFEIPFSKKERV
jgi:hypothetical protein